MYTWNPLLFLESLVERFIITICNNVTYIVEPPETIHKDYSPRILK